MEDVASAYGSSHGIILQYAALITWAILNNTCTHISPYSGLNTDIPFYHQLMHKDCYVTLLQGASLHHVCSYKAHHYTMLQLQSSTRLTMRLALELLALPFYLHQYVLCVPCRMLGRLRIHFDGVPNPHWGHPVLRGGVVHVQPGHLPMLPGLHWGCLCPV